MTDAGGVYNDATAATTPLDDLALFVDKKLVVLGGYGASGGSSSGGQQWRSMWDAFKNYGDGSDPPKEEIERSRGCNYYCGDCHALSFASDHTRADPDWDRLDFGNEASALLRRTGHSLTSLQAGGRLLLFGGRNLQRGDAPTVGPTGAVESLSCMNDAWLLELATPSRPPSLRELHAAGTPPCPRAHHTATLLGDTLYLLGGVCESLRVGETPLRDVHALHLPSGRWVTPQVMRAAPAVLAYLPISHSPSACMSVT